MTITQATASLLSDDNISCIPVGIDKIPRISAWGEFKERTPTSEEIDKWFSSDVNIALVAGAVQCIDFDDKYAPNIYNQFCERCAQLDAADILAKCLIQQTPSGGHHAIFKSAPNLKNQKLAMCADGRVAIETRGTGGYFLIYPSKNYEILKGDISNIPSLPESERDVLLEICRSFDEKPKTQEPKVGQQLTAPNKAGEISPGDDFDERANIPQLLTENEWQFVGGNLWRRPGKKIGTSASWDKIPNRFYVFSTSTEFEPHHLYRPWHVYAILHHGGDFAKAAAELYKLGYGTRRENKNNSAGNSRLSDLHQRIAPSPATRIKAGFPPILAHYESDEVESIIRIPDPVIKGILHRSCKMIISAPSKARKSWLLLDLGLSIAGGAHWLGFDTVKTPTLFIDLELKSGIFCRRRKDILSAKFAPNKKLPFYELYLRGHDYDFPEIAENIKTFVAEKNIGCLILDPIYKTGLGMDENKSADVAKLMSELEAFASESNCSIIFAHHYAKGNSSSKESIDRASGSGVWARDPDALIMLTPHEEEGSFVVEPHLRNFEPVSPFCITWEYPLWTPNLALSPDDLKGKADDKKQKKQKRELTALELNSLLQCLKIEAVTKENQRRILDAARCTQRNLWSAWAALKQSRSSQN